MQREQAVPNFQLGAFLFEHATLIDPLEGGSYGHVVQAVKLAQQQLHVEVKTPPPPHPPFFSELWLYQEWHVFLAIYPKHGPAMDSTGMPWAFVRNLHLICTFPWLQMALCTCFFRF